MLSVNSSVFADQDTFDQNMNNAQQVYQQQQQQQQQQQMQQYQKDAGTFVPGKTDVQVAPNTYVSPTKNGAQVTTTTK
jgi:hypothetical protein